MHFSCNTLALCWNIYFQSVYCLSLRCNDCSAFAIFSSFLIPRGIVIGRHRMCVLVSLSVNSMNKAIILHGDVSITIWWCCVWSPFFISSHWCSIWFAHPIVYFGFSMQTNEIERGSERVIPLSEKTKREVWAIQWWRGLDVAIEWHGTTIQTWSEWYDGINDVIVERHPLHRMQYSFAMNFSCERLYNRYGHICYLFVFRITCHLLFDIPTGFMNKFTWILHFHP